MLTSVIRSWLVLASRAPRGGLHIGRQNTGRTASYLPCVTPTSCASGVAAMFPIFVHAANLISSLFTNVPIEDTLDILKNYLQPHTVDLPFNSDVLLKLIELCTNNCYFSCNGNFFRQKRGLPMGSCISPVLSNIYMEFFERYLLPSVEEF